MMKLTTCVYVVVVHLVLVSSQYLTEDSPLYKAFLHFENIIQDGCNIDVLPDSIDWCDGKLNKAGKLPENTECQAIYKQNVHLICRKGKWIPLNHERVKRRLSTAYANVTNATCSRFCAEDTSEFFGKSAPYFGFCPVSVILFPESNETDVQYTWDKPEASDQDGNVTSLVRIVGPNRLNSTFEGSPSPGSSHVISYLATDDDNLNWTCSFVITAEIPTCPPIVHIMNGNSSCIDLNSRYSVCSFSCNHGYVLNGTISADCQENGTWSYGDDIPQCIAATCDGPIVTNSSDIEIVCNGASDDNDTNTISEFGSICWMQCPYDFLLVNDPLKETIFQELGAIVNSAITENAQARTEAIEAQNAADDAYVLALDLEINATVAENYTVSLETSLQSATEVLDNITQEYQDTVAELEQKQQEYETATQTGAQNAYDIQNQVNGLNETLQKLEAQIAILQQNMNELNQQLPIARNFSINIRNMADQALVDADEAQSIADDKLAIQNEATEAATHALTNYNEQFVYYNLQTAIVSSYAICTATGQWSIPGQPSCLDIHPPKIKCLPVITKILESGQTSSVVTWSEPEVYDNSGNVTLYRTSGPAPGSEFDLGQTSVSYRASDETGNLSPVCAMVINVNVFKCDDVATLIDAEYIEVTCDSFELGSTCNFTCSNYYTLEGTNNTTCQQNSSTLQMYWDLVDAPNCTVEMCAEPSPPANGDVECMTGTVDFDNITAENETMEEGLVCIFTCKEGYMLPYKTDSVYTCSEEGVWSSDNFPNTCIETGEQRSLEYTYQLQYHVAVDCASEDTATVMDDWAAFLTAEMPSYPACMMGYVCDVGEMASNCDTIQNDFVTIQFKIFATCEGQATGMPLEATCDILKDGAVSLGNSVTQSVDSKGVNINLVENWLTTMGTTFPECPSGAILVGSYCAQCVAGDFYDNGQDTCAPCVTGTFSESAGNLNCTTCPTGSSTLNTGSTECTAMCIPGTYSSTGLEPCATCKTGTFQSNQSENTCITCQENTWTTGERSDSADDCVAYDLYFDTNVADANLTTTGTRFSVAFWTKYYYPTQVTFGIFSGSGEPLFQLEVSELPQILIGWDNEPLDVTMETGTWALFGITCETSGDLFNISIYKDGELVLGLDIPQADTAETLRMSAGNGTFLSGLSVSHDIVDSTEMASLYDDCALVLSGTNYSLDDLAGTRLPAMKYTASTCRASNASEEANHCGLNRCKNNGVCVPETAGYSCNCTELFGGPFCEEILVHGNWSEWYDAAGCSVTCGTGTQLKYRFCNNPPRSEYGEDCAGNNTEIFDCFPGNCTVCEQPEIEGVAICEIGDDHCEATCPLGYVMPRGQQRQSYQCGETTNYQWMPMNRLPICAESRQPQRYTATLTFTFLTPVPCAKSNDVKIQMENVMSSLQCLTENSACASELEIADCQGQGSKRNTGTQMIIIFTIPLTVNMTFDLVEYYRTFVMTDSIFEAITAISTLEQTVQEILDNPGQFVAEVDGVLYTVDENNIGAITTTYCAVGEVPVGAVCAQCQKGTHETNGWCVYCDRGTYQTTSGQTSCISCPRGGGTSTIGARGLVECIALPEEASVTDITGIIIIVAVAVFGLIIVVFAVLMARRFYRSAKDRSKYDMEADRISLYTDFPDIAYNVYFKRRQVLGFDSKGYPIIKNTKFKNGPIANDKADSGKAEEIRPPVASYKEPTEYHDDQDVPFAYDPYALWADETFVSPYEYPQEDTFDFPKLENAVRYRVPGRKHFQNTYPMSQFGYEDSAHGRSRKNLPLPVNIPIPKKLPQLMYRRPDSMSLADILKSQFGFKKLKETEEEGIQFPFVKEETPVPPLSLKKHPGKKIISKVKGRKMSTASSIRSTRSDGVSPRSAGRALRSAKVWKASAVMKAKLKDRSPRATSAISPRSISTGTPSPRPATTLGRSPRSIDIDDGVPHPKPSRYIVPKDRPMPTTLPLPPKSALKVTGPDEPRPETGMTGRKSVTIREDANITRPSTSATVFKPSGSDASPREYSRPITDAKSARETIVAPYSAKPRSSFHTLSDHLLGLPTEVTEAYRPVSSLTRASTPAEHPKPTLHPGVTVKRSADHAMFFPPTNISFDQTPPVEQTLRQMAPPPFLNRVKPESRLRRNSSLKRTRFSENSDEISPNGSFFLTELPEELSASRVSLAGSILSRTSKSSKKPSPPPDYSASARDQVIETSMGEQDE